MYYEKVFVYSVNNHGSLNALWRRMGKRTSLLRARNIRRKKDPTGFIEKLRGMGKDVKWVYLKPGVKFRKYDSIKIKSFDTIANKSNKDIQKG